MESSPSNLFSVKFERGLFDNYGITLNELNSFKYCGGNKSRHANYYKLKFGDKPFLQPVEQCVCKHKIVENCYITNGSQIIPLGNCCIKRFMPTETSGRTCEICNIPHKNRKFNLCNSHKITHKKCKECNNYYEKNMIHINRQYSKFIDLCNECYKIKENEEEEKKIKHQEIEKNRRKNARKGLMNVTQTATIITQTKTCEQCNLEYNSAIGNNITLCDPCRIIKHRESVEENERIQQEQTEKRKQECKKMQEIGLMCYCELPTKIFTVNKETVNKGRQFYTCPKYYEHKCKYFMWKSVADENAILQEQSQT